jgi:hypothetical protein
MITSDPPTTPSPAKEFAMSTVCTSSRRTATTIIVLLTGVVLGLVGAGTSRAAAAVPPTASQPAASAVPLTNLTHLDWLRVRVLPPVQPRHTTYRLAQEPHLDVLWTYAEPTAGGDYRRVGGGTYDPATNTYGQGAFNADDISRAAVVYLRHWKATGSVSSRAAAREMLRGLTYLQTASGPQAGNVVLWMQPDGTLHPSANPPETPDPSDSAASYWLARTMWALGEGYAAFRHADPAFAGFLAARMDLAVAALDRQVLTRYGHFLNIDGRHVPAWLVVDGADASAEAVLGLAAYVSAGGPSQARTALAELSQAIAAMSGGDAQNWPFGAVLPWALSLSDWHAWASQMPAALARASVALGRPGLGSAGVTDSGTFDPWLLTSGGPDNGRLPTRIDASQIAYGIDSRMESLLATAEATHAEGPRRLAAITASWFFGANAAGVPAYDPATGRTVDGIAANGGVNRNAGAESTIHGLLAMLILDANPDIAGWARTADVLARDGTITLQAEDAVLGGGATAVTPASLWTGESQYGGTGYAALGNGGTVTFAVPSGQDRLVIPVVDLQPGSTAVTTFRSGGRVLGVVRSGDIGAQGDSPATGALLPVTLRLPMAAGATQVSASTVARGADRAVLDAVMLEPLVSRYVLSGDGHGTALLRSADVTVRTVTVSVSGSGPARVEIYDRSGQRATVRSFSSSAASFTVTTRVLPGGFTIVRR